MIRRLSCFLARPLAIATSLASIAVFSTGLFMVWSQGEGDMTSLGRPKGADLYHHYAAAKMWSEGNESGLYRESLLWKRMLEEQHSLAGNTGTTKEFNYVYPPLVAWASHWLAGLPYTWWCGAWLAFSVACFIASGFLLPSLLFPEPRYAIYWLGLPVFFFTLILGQNSALTLLVFSCAGLLLRKELPLAAGLIASCAFYKPQFAPLLFLFMLGARQWRFCAGLVSGSLLWALAGLLICGPRLHLDWLNAISGMGGGTQSVVSSLNTSLLWWIGEVSRFNTWQHSGPMLLLAGGLSMFFLGRHLSPRTPTPELIWLVALAGWCFCSPYVMFYDLLIAAPCWLFFLNSGKSRPWAGVGGILFWTGCVLAGNSMDLPISPAPPLLAAWFVAGNCLFSASSRAHPHKGHSVPRCERNPHPSQGGSGTA